MSNISFALAAAALDWFETIVSVALGIFVGIVLLATIGCLIYHPIQQILCWPKVHGEIVRYWITRSENQPDGQQFYHPVVRFKTTDGKPVLAISSWGSWRAPWNVGSIVPVRYHPDHPRWMEIQCFASLWGIPFTLLGLITMFCILIFLTRQMPIP